MVSGSLRCRHFDAASRAQGSPERCGPCRAPRRDSPHTAACDDSLLPQSSFGGSKRLLLFHTGRRGLLRADATPSLNGKGHFHHVHEASLAEDVTDVPARELVNSVLQIVDRDSSSSDVAAGTVPPAETERLDSLLLALSQIGKRQQPRPLHDPLLFGNYR